MAISDRGAAYLPLACVWLLLGVLLAGYVLLALRPASWTYLDYVDGYYLYVAQRMAQGGVLYRQLMGVQPPGIYLVGDWLFRLHDSLATIRVYAAALHAATVLLIYFTAGRARLGRDAALLAALLFSLAPYSLVWSRIFDPNPLVTALALLSIFCLLGGSPRWAVAAGVVGALALATKVWYVPVLLASLWYLARVRRAELVPFAAACMATFTAVCLAGTLSAGTDFWRGLLVQEASGLSVTWLLAAVIDVLGRDWLLLGLAFLALRAARGPRHASALSRPVADAQRLLTLYLAGSAVVLGAALKVGTFAPVFQFAEPALCLVAATLPFRLFGAVNRQADGAVIGHDRVGGRSPADHTQADMVRSGRRVGSGGMIVAGLGCLAVLSWWAAPALRGLSAPSDVPVHALVAQIRARSSPTSAVVAPPLYVYLAGRRAFDERSDLNLWASQASAGDRASLAAAADLARQLARGVVPIVLADRRVERLPVPVLTALHTRYRRLPFVDSAPVDRAVAIWVPR